LTWLAASPDFLTMKPIIPIRRKEPFDGDGWLFELKLDGFRGIANTVQGRMLFAFSATASAANIFR